MFYRLCCESSSNCTTWYQNQMHINAKATWNADICCLSNSLHSEQFLCIFLVSRLSIYYYLQSLSLIAIWIPKELPTCVVFGPLADVSFRTNKWIPGVFWQWSAHSDVHPQSTAQFAKELSAMYALGVAEPWSSAGPGISTCCAYYCIRYIYFKH